MYIGSHVYSMRGLTYNIKPLPTLRQLAFFYGSMVKDYVNAGANKLRRWPEQAISKEAIPDNASKSAYVLVLLVLRSVW